MRPLLALVIATGCAAHHVKLTPTNSSPVTLKPRTQASVEVFTSTQPQRPFMEVAIITSDYGDAGKDIDAIREKASDYGCDAVVFSRVGSTDAVSGTVQGKPGELGHPVSGAAVSQSSAACVVYTGEAPARAPVADPNGEEGGVEGGVVGGAAK